MPSKRKSRSISPPPNPKSTEKPQKIKKNPKTEAELIPDPVIETPSTSSEPKYADVEVEADENEEEEEVASWSPKPKARSRLNNSGSNPKPEEEDYEGECLFTSLPIPDKEAKLQYPHRYTNKITKSSEGGELVKARRHFTEARVDGIVYRLFDDACVKAEGGEEDYICRIVEMFEGEGGGGGVYCNVQWYYRAKDTVIGMHSSEIDEKCVFLSEVKDDNLLDCLVKKVKIVRLSGEEGLDLEYKKSVRESCDFYYEMSYSLAYTSFVSNRTDSDVAAKTCNEKRDCKEELVLMDLYAGCGAMSTGLCLGAGRGGVKLTTKWAIDINEFACESLRLNHPETNVRNEPAEDFLGLIREWYRLCCEYSLVGDKDAGVVKEENGEVNGCGGDNEEEEEEEEGGEEEDGEVYEVDEILEICYGDPNESKKPGLHFKISWKGYSAEHNSWEPMDCLSGCPEKLKEFVVKGFESKFLPLPGDVDVICGGPPCQGISGFNRFRNKANPLADEKNKQLIVFMDIVSFLRPKYVLMENVVDIIKFAEGFLGKYALGRLVGMGYQARIGMMAAGSYGLPQFRMRAFFWGALSTKKLPQYALPTHKVVNRGVVPVIFEPNVVAYEEGKTVELKKEVYLAEALSDLPPVENSESRDEMPYNGAPKTDFQRFIRLKKEGMLGSAPADSKRFNEVLYDHRPLQMNEDDYQRACQIPMRKGACFRDLSGVIVGPDNKVLFDPEVKRVYLPSGKPLVPDYAMTFVNGTSSAPFGRVWWDQTVPTVVTRAQPHNRCIMHPSQNRVLTVRENARLQGFPDYYQLIGPIKQRYMQVGNAVAVPVARALGYCLALASKGDTDDTQAVLELPSNFSKVE